MRSQCYLKWPITLPHWTIRSSGTNWGNPGELRAVVKRRPAAGKFTFAKRVPSRHWAGGYGIENLFGDEIRETLHPELCFSGEDHATNN